MLGIVVVGRRYWSLMVFGSSLVVTLVSRGLVVGLEYEQEWNRQRTTK